METGFLTREYREEKSSNCLTLTDRGREAFALCHQVFADWDASRLAEFTREEQETLTALLRRLTISKEGD